MTNSAQFTLFSRLLHWTMAAMILTMLFIGVAMVASLADYHLLISIHRPLGIAILVLVIVRYVNRRINPPPPFPASMSSEERFVAHTSEMMMYAMMFGLPLIGWGMLSAERYPIVLYGDPVLEKLAEPVTEFDEGLKNLAEDMFESMYAAHGVGLAAPQIGISKRLVVIDVTFKEDPKARLVLVNPEIISREGRQNGHEGCLSLPEFREHVVRANVVTVRAQDVHGKWFEKTGEELLARAFLHETDHLNGRLFISHVSGLKRDLIKRKIKKLVKAGEWQ